MLLQTPFGTGGGSPRSRNNAVEKRDSVCKQHFTRGLESKAREEHQLGVSRGVIECERDTPEAAFPS